VYAYSEQWSDVCLLGSKCMVVAMGRTDFCLPQRGTPSPLVSCRPPSWPGGSVRLRWIAVQRTSRTALATTKTFNRMHAA
jgi:hypothetical protein